MDPERYARVKAILADLLERQVTALDPAAYEAALDEACGDDPTIRAEVEELLGFDADKTEALDPHLMPLEHLAVVPSVHAAAPLPAPDSIGPYRIVGTLGQGGMGTVYRAEQTTPVERSVALKVIRHAVVDPATRLRFSAERQALARLVHPHIAQLYEAGSTDDGSPYFAMELVEGAPITIYCDRDRLGIEARLALFVQVCEGVAHAHRKGILHRDLKPSNVLIVGSGTDARPKIIDFGIAKAMDRPLVEATLVTGGGLLGTPAYMSPEAVSDGARVDTRSDVYSLGVILYELLIGVRPLGLPDDDPLQLLSRIAREEAVRPSTRWRRLDPSSRDGSAAERGQPPEAVSRALRGDLDWIVMRAIAKEPEQRYGSARELAAEIERHLHHEPVEARPPTLSYRASRFVRRNRLAVGAALLVLLSLIAGVVGTGLGLLEARREAEATRRALAEASAVSDYLVELFRLAAPVAAQGEEVTARDLLAGGPALAAERFAEQPAARARFLRTIAQSYHNLALYDEAAPVSQQALDTLEPLREELPLDWFDNLTAHAWTEHRRGRYEEAHALYEQAISFLDRHPELPEQHRPEALESMAYVAMEQGEYDEAFALLNDAIARFRSIDDSLRGEPDTAASTSADGSSRRIASRRALLRALDKLGVVEQRRDHPEAAVRLHTEALAEAEAVYGEEHSVTATASLNLGTALYRLGRSAEGLAASERALEIRRALYGDEHDEVARALNNTAQGYLLLDQLDQAEAMYRKTLETSLAQLGPRHPKLAAPYNNLAVVASRRGEMEQALDLLEKALEARQTALGPDHPEIANLHGGIGWVLESLGRYEEAEVRLETAQRILEERLGPDHDQTLYNLQSLASLYDSTGRGDEAERVLQRALEARERLQDADHPDLASVRGQLGDFYLRRGDLARAAPLLEAARAAHEQSLSPNDPFSISSLESLAAVRLAQGELDEALSLATEALARLEAGDVQDPERLAKLNALIEEIQAGQR